MEVDVIETFIASFDGSERQESIAKVWECDESELSYKALGVETITWMRESLKESAEKSARRFRKIYGKRGKSQEWVESHVDDAVLRSLDTDEHFLWLAELAHRAAPDDKKAQRWILS